MSAIHRLLQDYKEGSSLLLDIAVQIHDLESVKIHTIFNQLDVLAETAIEHIEEVFYIKLSPYQARTLLMLYPRCAIALANSNTDLLTEAMADHLTGLPWPTYGDKIEDQMPLYIEMIRKQAVRFGYELVLIK